MAEISVVLMLGLVVWSFWARREAKHRRAEADVPTLTLTVTVNLELQEHPPD